MLEFLEVERRDFLPQIDITVQSELWPDLRAELSSLTLVFAPPSRRL